MTNQDKKKLAKFWLDGSTKDMAAARHLIQKAKLYPQGLFFLHLSIEKILKYIYVLKFGGHAPFTHNLLHLVDRCEIVPPSKLSSMLAVISEFNLSTRYPDQKTQTIKKFNAVFAKKHLSQGQELYEWLLKESKLML